MVKYQYEIRKYFTSKLYVVFTPISTKTSYRNRTNYSRGRLRETPRSFCGGTGSERSVFDLFQSKGKSSEPTTDVEDTMKEIIPLAELKKLVIEILITCTCSKDDPHQTMLPSLDFVRFISAQSQRNIFL